MFENKRQVSVSLAAGGRPGKKRQAHRDQFLLTTVLCLKCRSLCTKIQLCWPQHPKENKRTEERHKLWGGEWEKKSKLQNRESEFTERERGGWEQERGWYPSYTRAEVLNRSFQCKFTLFRLFSNFFEDYRRQILIEKILTGIVIIMFFFFLKQTL